MSQWHQDELRLALESRGWRILAEHPGDGRRISGSWEIQRSTHHPTLWIDFEGLDDSNCLPIAKSYSCVVRGFPALSLDFRKRRYRQFWSADLKTLLYAIEVIDAGEQPKKEDN